jgi:hypothetical protein
LPSGIPTHRRYPGLAVASILRGREHALIVASLYAGCAEQLTLNQWLRLPTP